MSQRFAEESHAERLVSRLQSQTKQSTRLINQLHETLSANFPELATLINDLAANWVLLLLEKYPTAQRLADARLRNGQGFSVVFRSAKATHLSWRGLRPQPNSRPGGACLRRARIMTSHHPESAPGHHCGLPAWSRDSIDQRPTEASSAVAKMRSGFLFW